MNAVGRQYVPSNGTEGHAFLDAWCRHCARDKSMREGAEVDECDDSELCPIIAASFMGEAKEWRELDDGRRICTAYVEAGQPIPARCPNTADMFDAELSGAGQGAATEPGSARRPT